MILKERVRFSPVGICWLVRRLSAYERGSRSFVQQHDIKQRYAQSAHKALAVPLHQAAPTGWTCKPTRYNNSCLETLGGEEFPGFVALLESWLIAQAWLSIQDMRLAQTRSTEQIACMRAQSEAYELGVESPYHGSPSMNPTTSNP